MKLPLHLKLGAAVSLLILLCCAAMLAVVHHAARQADLESVQRINLGLARYVAEHQAQPLLDAQGAPNRPAMAALASHVMAINPAVELYLLDREGQVLAHALHEAPATDPVGRRVDLAAVQPLVAGGDAPRLPVLGDDPRQPGRHSVVSVAPLTPDAHPAGYLYLVLQGRAQRAVAAELAGSLARREMLGALLLVAAAGSLAVFFVLGTLTRPLRQLARQVQAIRAGDAPPAVSGRDEIELLRSAVAALQARVDSQFRRLEEADQQRRDLVSGISHDLRTPLASLRGFLETVLLKGDALPPDTRTQYLRTSLRQAERLRQRIGELFELSKLDAGRVEPRLDVFCLAELLQDVIQAYQPAARERGVRLRLADDSHRAAPVRADIALIERVMQNLIDNALRFTPQGGSVTLAVSAREGGFSVSVADTGRGIAAEHLPYIFDRYWRSGDEDELRSGASSGLGLAIVKRILEIHGSAVRVSSQLAQGTRFEFALPQAA
ncbi:sensor histidine kinase [Aquabacterium sp.]|uniref:sensor histidine kinase n=1 Tax=Aquabacterium sp. TaxID=1872578 RepID=UPI0037839354